MELDLAVRLSSDDFDGRPIDLTPHRNSWRTGSRLIDAYGEPLGGSGADPLRMAGGRAVLTRDGSRPGKGRGEFRHDEYNSAIAVAATGVAAIAVALATAARTLNRG
jgi:hypothetical protein